MIKKFLSSLSYGVIGLIFMNVILTFVVNPNLSREVGADGHGRILFYVSVINLLASTFGSGANYARMKIYSEERKTVNGEYNLFLVMSAVCTAVIILAAAFFKQDTAEASLAGLIVLAVATIVRFYADVQFRLDLNYKRFAIFYIVVGAGYTLGYLLYRFTSSWVFIYLAGEVCGLIYVYFAGTVFKKPFTERTEKYPKHLGTMWSISGSYFLSDFVSGADRLLFPFLLLNGDELTGLYYYASLVGKMMSLLSTPLNGVLSGFIAKSSGGLSRKRFLGITGIMLGIFAAVTGASVLGSHIFVYYFYHPYYETVRSLFLLANAGQVIFFICNTMMVVVLRFTHERNQFIISGVYIVLFFAVAVPLILKYGLFGMAWGIFIANSVKFILYAVLGYFGLPAQDSVKKA